MVYSTEQIEQIKEYAGYLVKVSDIAVLIKVDPDVLRRDISDKKNPAFLAYRTGKANTALLLRKQEIDMAKVGSPLAVQLTSTYLMEMEDDEDM